MDESTKNKELLVIFHILGKKKQKNIAFKDARVSTNKVNHLEIELDADDGKMVYDIEFDANNIEYEYEINAKSGDVIKKETEKNKINQKITNYEVDDDND